MSTEDGGSIPDIQRPPPWDNWPRRVTARGTEWPVEPHVALIHRDVTDAQIVRALDDWNMTGERLNERREWMRHYLLWIPEKGLSGTILRVVTPLIGDGERVVSAHFDDNATRHWLQRNMDYFRSRYRDMEMS